jgi:putative aminopeptidase FrvX
MDDSLRELIAVPGVSGREEAVRAWIESRLPDGAERSVDTMGNLTVSFGEGDADVLFIAHMDEIGFLVSEIRDDGFLRLRPLGGIDPRAMFGQALRIETANGILPGVITVVPPHLMRDRAKEMGDVPAISDWLVDVGASSGDEARALGFAVLDQAVPEKGVRVLNEKFWSARGLDDRVGCWILLQALSRFRPEGRVHFVFSTQEEVGLRGAQLVARRLAPDYAFAVDSASAADFPGVGADLSPACLGAGAALRVVDSAAIMQRDFTQELEVLAAAESIPLQTIFCGGGTDVRSFQAEGSRCMALGIPLRYAHSMIETVHADDVEATIRLIGAIIGRYAK